MNTYIPARSEIPTWVLLAFVYSAWAGMILYWHSLPSLFLIPAGSLLLCLYGSVQHELTHGHPTRNALINNALGSIPLNLWLPFKIYKDSHMAHHNNEIITCPLEDPESFYVSPETWKKSGPVLRRYYRFRNTLAGRVLAGPAEILLVFYWRQIRAIFHKDRKTLQAWAIHLPLTLLLTGFLIYQNVNIAFYFFCLVYPGLSLTLIRSFAEHKFEEDPHHRSGIIEAGLFWRLLFLNNNYHAIHHENPRICWHALPKLFNMDPKLALDKNGNYYLPSYKELFRKYFFHSWDHPVRKADRIEE